MGKQPDSNRRRENQHAKLFNHDGLTSSTIVPTSRLKVKAVCNVGGPKCVTVGIMIPGVVSVF